MSLLGVASDVAEFVGFVSDLTPELIALKNQLSNGVEDTELEKQLAMDIIRKAKDVQAKKEIEG